MGDNIRLSKEERDLLHEYKEYCKDNHLRCNTSCGLYDTVDKDCEIFGNSKLPISECGVYFDKWRKEKEKKEK